MIFKRVVRGMVPHKTTRGEQALKRLKAFEGMPFPYSHRKKGCVPMALKVLRLRSDRKYTLLRELSRRVGWKRNDVLERLEGKRKDRAGEYFEKKEKVDAEVEKRVKGVKEVRELRAELEKYGY